MKKRVMTIVIITVLLFAAAAGCARGDSGADNTAAPETQAPASPPASESPPESTPPSTGDTDQRDSADVANKPNTLDVDVSMIARHPGFSRLAGAENFLVGVSIRTLANPFFYAQAVLLQQYLTELGFRTTGVMDANMDLDREIEIIEQMIAQEADLIIIVGIQPGASEDAVQHAISNGVPTIAAVVDLGSAPSFNVVCDNALNGYLAGYHLGANYLRGETINSIHIGDFAEAEGPGADRARGMFAGIVAARLDLDYSQAFQIGSGMFDDMLNTGRAANTEADFNILGVGYGELQEELGLAAAEELLAANQRQINLMTGENDIILRGAFRAVENFGIQEQVYMIAGSDAHSGTVRRMMEDPGFQLVATGINSPYMIAAAVGEAVAEVLIDGRDPDSFPVSILASAGIVTKDNAPQAFNPGSLY